MKTIILRDSDGQKWKVWLRSDCTVTQLRKTKEQKAQYAEEGRDFLGRLLNKPNPQLAARYRAMTLMEFLRVHGCIAASRCLERNKT